MLTVIWRILATLGLVALNGAFVAAEFAAVGARTSRLEREARTNHFARIGLIIKRRLDLYLSACQLGITIASLGLGAMIEPAVASILAKLAGPLNLTPEHQHTLAFGVSFFVSIAFHIIIGEQAPKNWAILNPDRMLAALALPLMAFTVVFYPLIWLLNWATNAVLRFSGIPTRHDLQMDLPHTADELRTLLNQSIAKGTIGTGSGQILTSAFDFGDLKVRQIMTPRTEVDYLLMDQPLGEVLNVVQKTAYTRRPLCDGDIDHVIGLIHTKDLFNHLQLMPGRLRFTEEKTPDGQAIAIASGLPGSAVHVIGSGDIALGKIKRDILFVPALLPVPKLLRQFQASHIHMAVVVDEYGATLGIVTLEDVLEEIVGEIEDEFDTSTQPGFVAESGGYRVSGLFPIHDLRDRLNLPDLQVADVDTVNGYVVQQLARWPRVGDSVPMGPYIAKVLAVNQQRATQVLITPTSGKSPVD